MRPVGRYLEENDCRDSHYFKLERHFRHIFCYHLHKSNYHTEGSKVLAILLIREILEESHQKYISPSKINVQLIYTLKINCSYGPKGQVAFKLGWCLNYSKYGSVYESCMPPWVSAYLI